ncbi:hypothetical protein FNV43_RR17989 [Rhamnella rubrinervis]|uniref:Protein kinase domain-containing protein n=1 Tax=Rhamnella rubrinervis TaxID=2594499 RepID=A0A8K0E3P6_9ROSA|nr:hypothetical protein FNV43_RR17989 [Rhamnella rubrinervis]
MAAVRQQQLSLLPLLLLFFFLHLFPHLSLSESEADALIKFKNSLTQSNALSSWVPNSSPCKSRWVGVMCFDGTISGLHLTSMGLAGKIDIDALLDIRGLRTISFMNNNFTGQMPQFNKLGALKSLLLSGNGFTGEIPKDFFSNLNSLKKVWLNDNKFTGNIPESLGKLTLLIELHLENNQFTGPIPELKKTIKSLDVSNNKLEGQIPVSLSNYNSSTFSGNDGLCGKPLDKACDNALSTTTPDDNSAVDTNVDDGGKSSSTSGVVIGVVIAVVVLSMVFMFVGKRRRSREREFSQLSKDYVDEQVVEVHDIPSSNSNRSSRSNSQPTRKNSESRKGSHHSKNGMTDLIIVNDEKGTFGLPDLMKAAAEVLGNGGLGSAYKAVMSNGLSVVVKRMREMNKLARDGFDTEMRRFGRIRHKNILTPLAYHYRREEKLLVSEYIPKGSLLYVLHGDRGASHADLKWPIRLTIIQGIANGMSFLQAEFESYDLPHGNLKSSNVLLDQNYEPLLSDYAFQPLMHDNNAEQTMFAYKTPDYTQYHQVSPKTDVYCLGIIILEILTGKFPSQYLSNGKGGIDVVEWVLSATQENRERELLDPEIAAVSTDASVNQMLQLLEIGAACSVSNPQHRPDMKEAIRRIGQVQA